MQSVGLLFVHGIGEQKRFEHLRASVRDLAQLIRASDADLRVSVVDRTIDWKNPPGTPTIAGDALMTISVVWPVKKNEPPREPVSFECHEVWWADLGARTSVLDSIGFWIWGLGQWSALIYQNLDVSGLAQEKKTGMREMVEMPVSVAGRFWLEAYTRLRLACAGLATTFTLVTLSLAKYLASKAGAQVPATLLVQYLGDVRQYEQRASPRTSSHTDPGHPLRVGIRRRMVTEMVAMGARGHDRWYVLAHSLGSVLAYNGLTELSHTLPNYLPKPLWQQLPESLKTDNAVLRREHLHDMMPARPPWLYDHHVINRRLLFAHLRGFLTYGSPLDKFAAIWPRIVASACDQHDRAPPFAANFEWLNIASPHDPVAGKLDQYRDMAAKGAIKAPHNVWTRLGIDFLVSHIRYLSSTERFVDNERKQQQLDIARWLMHGLQADSVKPTAQGAVTRVFGMVIGYVLILLLAWGAAALSLTLLGGIWQALTGANALARFESPAKFVNQWCSNLGVAIGLGMVAILMMGLYRWICEIVLNLALARHDRKPVIVGLLLTMLALVSLYTAIVVPSVLLAAMADFWPDKFNALFSESLVAVMAHPPGYAGASWAAAAVLAAIVLQSLFNFFAQALRRRLEHRAPAKP